MSTQQLHRTEIPKSLVARSAVLISVLLAYLCIYGVAAMTTSPQGSGETPGEAVMARGAFFFTFAPFAAFAALLAATLTIWQKRHLSRLWIFAGLSPAFSLLPLVLYVFFNFGDF